MGPVVRALEQLTGWLAAGGKLYTPALGKPMLPRRKSYSHSYHTDRSQLITGGVLLRQDFYMGVTGDHAEAADAVSAAEAFAQEEQTETEEEEQAKQEWLQHLQFPCWDLFEPVCSLIDRLHNIELPEDVLRTDIPSLGGVSCRQCCRRLRVEAARQIVRHL